ncbi:MAG: helix-turn-helix domain-containing protein [Verrucomicrobiaceae bacterium]|nr:helix-turn-helix domain-containing protein [Verrucomicrobiaceae bacterium]
MSSRSLTGSTSLSRHTRSSNGSRFAGTLWARMELSTDDPAPDEMDAARILREELNLTQRQAQVLHWVAEGKSNEEIGTILGCSINTVKMHIKDIFKRLGIHSRSAATGYAYRAHIRNAARHAGTLPERVIPRVTQPR